MDRQGQLTSMALSGKKFEFTVVISMWRDGVAIATRGPTVRNASTGQRMHVRSLQLNIKSHVSIELNVCVSGQRSRRIRAILRVKRWKPTCLQVTQTCRQCRLSRDLASEIFFYGKELLLAQCVSRKDRCQHVCRGSSVSGNVLPGSTWDWVSRV